MVEDLLKSGELPCLVATSLARARHRHGRRGPGDPGGVAQVGHRRAAAHRPRRPRRGRGLARAHLPQVPRRPARVRRRRASACATARSSRPSCPRNPLDVLAQQVVAMTATGDEWSVPELHEPGPARLPVRGAVAASCSTACSTCSTAATRPRSSPSCARASSGTGWRTPIRARKGALQLAVTNAARSPTAACTASTCPTAAAWASSTRRWSTRRARARRSCWAPPPGASRRSRATA